jgi:mRNA interferase RelE/StbE
MYEVLFSPAAERYFKELKEKGLKDAYRTALDRLEEDPYIGQPKRGDLAGIYGYDVNHAGVNYEIAYVVYEESTKRVVVMLAGSRQNFYEQLKRYID